MNLFEHENYNVGDELFSNLPMKVYLSLKVRRIGRTITSPIGNIENTIQTILSTRDDRFI